MNPLRPLRNLFAPEDTPIAPRSGVIGGLITLVALAMSFIAVVAFEAGLAADRIAGQWSAELTRSATVRITAAPEDAEAVTAAALSVLKVAPGVASARALTEEELQALLAPWLGRDADISALPVPGLIDVRLAGAGPDVEDVQRQLDLAAPGAIYDDHGEWRGPLISAARGMRMIAMAGVALAAAALAAMIGVAATASFWVSAGVVNTLRMIGAEDRYISGAFERQFALRAGIGGVFGAAFALGAAARLPEIEGAEILSIGADAAQTPTLWLGIAAPLACALTALIATRLASFFVLRRAI